LCFGIGITLVHGRGQQIEATVGVHQYTIVDIGLLPFLTAAQTNTKELTDTKV